uniref:Uncharacterized protein n=1 Tax=Arundo donax TaxID=35708 RepID=A0A0A8ZXN9_ARUDO
MVSKLQLHPFCPVDSQLEWFELHCYIQVCDLWCILIHRTENLHTMS